MKLQGKKKCQTWILQLLNITWVMSRHLHPWFFLKLTFPLLQYSQITCESFCGGGLKWSSLFSVKKITFDRKRKCLNAFEAGSSLREVCAENSRSLLSQKLCLRYSSAMHPLCIVHPCLQHFDKRIKYKNGMMSELAGW